MSNLKVADQKVLQLADFYSTSDADWRDYWETMAVILSEIKKAVGRE